MKRILTILLTVLLVSTGFFACKKWIDPPATNDPRLTNPYCNNPDAVNYNWGFPGKPDNSICFFPKDLFIGDYSFVDSILVTSTNLFVRRDSMVLHFYSVPGSNSKISVVGFCGGGDTLKLTAGPSYVATVDTLIGDSLTNRGQHFCRVQDTVNGTIYNSRLDTLLHVTLQVISDTGTTTHMGKAKKL